MNEETLLRMEAEREDRAFMLAVIRMCVVGVVLVVVSMAGCEIAVKSMDPCAGAMRSRPAWCETRVPS